MTMGSIITTPHVSFNGAFPLKKVRRYSSIFMRKFVGIMLHQGAWLGRLLAGFLLANGRQ
jgi:hypothetical protein